MPSSPMGKTLNLDLSQAALNLSKTPSNQNFRSKIGFDRPHTAMQNIDQMRNKNEYLRIKNEGENSKIQLGNERRIGLGTPMGGNGTDYRTNY